MWPADCVLYMPMDNDNWSTTSDKVVDSTGDNNNADNEDDFTDGEAWLLGTVKFTNVDSTNHYYLHSVPFHNYKMQQEVLGN